MEEIPPRLSNRPPRLVERHPAQPELLYGSNYVGDMRGRFRTD